MTILINMAINIHEYENCLIEYEGEQYICTGYKKNIDRYVLFTNRLTLALFYSQMEKVIIIRKVTLAELRSAKNRLNEKQKILESMKFGIDNTPKPIAIGDRLTPDQIDYIVKNWSKVGSKACSDTLGITKSRIRKVVNDHNLILDPSMVKKPLSDEVKEFINSQKDKLSIAEMARITEQDINLMYAYAKSVGIKTERKDKIPVMYKYNPEVTKKSKINTRKKITSSDSKKNREEEDTEKKAYKLKIKVFTEEEEKDILDNWGEKSMSYFLIKYKSSRSVFFRSIEYLKLDEKKYVRRTKLEDFTEEQITFIRENWKEMTITQIINKLSITEFQWNKFSPKLGLPKKSRGAIAGGTRVFKSRVVIKSEFTEEEKQFIIDNWSKMRPVDFKAHFNLSEHVWSRRIKAMDLPDRKNISISIKPRSYKTKLSEKEVTWVRDNWSTKTMPEICRYIGLSYSKLNPMLKDLGFTRKKNIRTSTTEKVDRERSFRAWHKDDQAIITKAFMVYNKGKNEFIQSNEINAGKQFTLPILIQRYKDIEGYQRFEDFATELAISMGILRKTLMSQMVRCGLLT